MSLTKNKKRGKLRGLLILAILANLNLAAFSGLPVSLPSLLDSSAPVIKIWYGDNQVFGEVGTPQNWINILGNVSDPESGVSALSYTLNGVYQGTLTIGPDLRRLQNAGDFNIDIAITNSNLIRGNNTVQLTARNGDGDYAYHTVNFVYADNTTWYLPYTIDWNTVSNLQEAVQIVDGKWEITNNGARTVEWGYDRLLNIGDLIWQEYEIKVPITINEYYKEYDQDHLLPWQSANPGFGITLHWTGHTDDPVVCDQPECGWNPYGGNVWYEFFYGSTHALKLSTQELAAVETTTIQIDDGDTYWFKIRVEKNTSGNLYKLKVWRYGTTEPAVWILTQQSVPNNLDHGSIILNAHHVDLTFGDITVTPLNGDLTLNLTAEHGSISTDPDKSNFQYGELVTLTAQANSGWVFDHWSGDVNGSDNPETIIMSGDQSVTAVFTESPAYILSSSVSPSSSGIINIIPDKLEYAQGETVQLTAVNNPGYVFSHWSGSINSTENPLTFQIEENTNLTANFTNQYYSLDIISTQGTVSIDPNQSSYTYNTPVQLTASPNPGWVFSHWTGDINTNQNPANFLITSDMQIIAVYDLHYQLFIPLLAK